MMEDPEESRERTASLNKREIKKLVDDTDIWGLQQILSTDKSRTRRLIWLTIFLAAVAACCYTIVKSGLQFASRPASTTISLELEPNLSFPAVTICSLGPLSRSYLEEKGLFDTFNAAVNEGASCTELPIVFNTLLREGGHPIEDFILMCRYDGSNCTDDDFVETFTELGLCYIFNSNATMPRMVGGTSSVNGLQLILNISQDDYIGIRRQEAGVKIDIHPQGAPGTPDNKGIGVPPGKSAYIGLQEKVFIDESSKRKCIDGNGITYNYLQRELDYSSRSCVVNSFLENVAKSCECVPRTVWTPPNSQPFISFPDCSEEHACCVAVQYFNNQAFAFDCQQACSFTTYTISNSYTDFPATSAFQLETLGNNLNLQDLNYSYLENNLLAVNIYFEDLHVEKVITKDSYTFVNLLADIGGHLGLFIGAGVLSFIQLSWWIFDVVRDRCCSDLREEKVLAKAKKLMLERLDSSAALKSSAESNEDSKLSEL